MTLEDVVAVKLTLYTADGYQTMTVRGDDWQIETPDKLYRIVKLMVTGIQRAPVVALPGGDDY